MKPPRSMVSRMAWLVGVVGLLSFVMHALVINALVRPRFQEMTLAVTGQVSLIKALIDNSATPLAEDDLQRQLPSVIRIEKLGSDSALPVYEIPWFARSANAEIKQNLPEGVEFAVSDRSFFASSNQWMFEFRAANERWRIYYQLTPPVMALFGSILGWMALIACAVFATLWVGVRLVTRPMRDLSTQLLDQKYQIAPLEAPPHASAEVSAIVGAFNRLVEEIMQADAMRLQMLAGLSHDLRTPLTRLRLRIETDMSEADTRALSADIEAMQKIISQFMAYVHGTTGGNLGQPESVVEQLQHLVAPYGQQVQSLQILIEDPQARLPDVAFARVVSNLLDNALSHGAAPIEVVLSTQHPSGFAEHVLTVYDHGSGMSPQQLQEAQKPFVRLSSRDNEVGHCGLGLAIVAHIAMQLGGRLSCHHDAMQRFAMSFAWRASALPER